MNRVCLKCKADMILDCEVYPRISSVASHGLGIQKKKGEGFFNCVHATVKATLCPECGTIEYYIENPKEFL